MNIKLYKIEKGYSENNLLDAIVLCNLENIILFTVQILKKEDGSFLCVLPKRNRKEENGVDTEYFTFSSFKKRDEFIDLILKEYKKNKDNLSFYEETNEQYNTKLDLETKEIKHDYIKYYIKLIINKDIIISGFKLGKIENNNLILTPSFFKNRVLYNKFKLTSIGESKLFELLCEKNLISFEEPPKQEEKEPLETPRKTLKDLEHLNFI